MGWSHLRLLPVTFAVGLLSVACQPGGTSSSAECSSNQDCEAGNICSAGTCELVCASDNQCPDDEACLDGICQPCDGCRDVPEVTSINGTGSEDQNPDHASQHLRGRLVLRGRNLEGASVEISGGSYDGQELELCEPGTFDRLEVGLPADVAATTYTLTVSNQAGSCSSEVTLLQGEPGEYTVGQGLQQNGDELAVEFGSEAGTVAAGDDPRFHEPYTDSDARSALADTLQVNLARNGGFTQGATAGDLPRHFRHWSESGGPDGFLTLVQEGEVSPVSIEVRKQGDGEGNAKAYGLQQYIYPRGSVPTGLAGRTFTASMWVKYGSGLDTGRIGIADAGADLDEASVTWTDLTSDASSWERVIVSHTVSSNPEYLKIIMTPGTDQSAFATYVFNGLMVTEGSEAPRFRPHYQDGAPQGASAQTPAASCKAIRNRQDPPVSGRYWVDPDGEGGIGPYPVYCDMQTAGGGWMLLLSLHDPLDQYASGTVNPMVSPVNESQPDPGTPYSRNWLDDLGNDAVTDNETELMIRNETTGQFVRAVVTDWCGWQKTSSECLDSDGDGHGYYAKIRQPIGGLAPSGAWHFNLCALDGGCQETGSDAPGFSTNNRYSLGPDDGFGAGWTGDRSTASKFYWNGRELGLPQAMTYWIR